MSKTDQNNTPSNRSGTDQANITWRENGQPLSTHYDDIYFSTESGMDETVHTFINPNHLPERFRALDAQECLTIAETGFGTGLNFLCAWQQFDQTAQPGAQLHFISTEKHPLSHTDFQRALQLWPTLQPYASELSSIYLPACQGHHHFVFSEGRIRLTLLIGDVLDTLPELSGTVDAWFLDGFAPSKNPAMWCPALFNTMAAKSHAKTTFATFTAARSVRDGLVQAGFSVEKIPGYGRKRHMIRGRFPGQSQDEAVRSEWRQPSAPKPASKKAIVIGGGLAGTSTARSLAERGWRVQLLERHSSLAREASGNPQGILYTKLSANHTALSRFILQGYLHSIHRLNRLGEHYQDCWHKTGVVQLASTDSIRQRQQALAETFPESLLFQADRHVVSEFSGLDIDQNGLIFPEAGWVNPARLCNALADHPAIQIQSNASVASLHNEQTEWILMDEQQQEIARAEIVVMAGGTSSHLLEPFQHLPLKAIRGQISQIKATEESLKLSTCVCSEGYLAPAYNGEHTLGATFDFDDNCHTVRNQDHQRNLALQSSQVPELYESIGGSDAEITGGRTGFRCTTPDYLPVVGPVANRDAFIRQFTELSNNAKARIDVQPAFHNGLYVNAGHGSRGLVTCLLSGEVIASMISGNTHVVEASILQAMNPNRFLIRDLKRNRLNA